MAARDETVRVPRVAGVKPGRHRAPDDGERDSEAVVPAVTVAGLRARAGQAVRTDSAARSAVHDEPGASAATEPFVPPAKSSRAGRNLPAAIAIGLLMGGLVLASLFTVRESFVGLVCVAVGYGTWELTTAIGTVEARPPLLPLLVGGLAMEFAAWYRAADGLTLAFFVTIAAAAIWRLADGAVGYQRDLAASVLIAFYLPLLAGFAVLLAYPDDGAARVITFVGTVVCSDTGGYAAGVLFGKHPLAPMVSKGKTWEGAVGSVIACVACGSLILHFTFHHPWWQGAVFGLAIMLVATLGDLGESMIKRDLALKDMGRLLPGHGGLMDRLDSLLPCAAVGYLMLTGFLGG